MTTAQRTYRGIPYDPAQHERLSPASVDHTYRGQHYDAPLCHAAAAETTRVRVSASWVPLTADRRDAVSDAR